MRALILGACGQDGPYLAEHLAQYGYEVVGVAPPWDHGVTEADEWLKQRGAPIEWAYGDLTDPLLPRKLIDAVEPDELYNLAAITFVPASWEQAEWVGQVNGLAVARMLETVRQSKKPPRMYQASTSEMFGESPPAQHEGTQMRPVSPYAAAKVFAHTMVGVYRQSYGMHVSSGILFNHESPRRPEKFVTRHVTHSAVRVKLGKQRSIPLGNLDGMRDWGHARDYVKAMHAMVLADEPDDYVIGTGVACSVWELVKMVCTILDLDPEEVVEVDRMRFRPVETAPLVADPRKARRELGWHAETSLFDMLEEMITHDWKLEIA